MFPHFSPQLIDASQRLVCALKLVDPPAFSMNVTDVWTFYYFTSIKSTRRKGTSLEIPILKESPFSTRRVFFAITDSPLQTHLLFNFAAIQAQAHTTDTADNFAAQTNKDQTGTRPSRPFRRIHTLKVITGSLKTLCLPHLGRINDITSALLIRRESL
jgi:hypothetical protein